MRQLCHSLLRIVGQPAVAGRAPTDVTLHRAAPRQHVHPRRVPYNSQKAMAKLTAFPKRGEVAMVDVTAKAVTERTAVARGFVRMSPAVLRALRQQKLPKGNPLEIARIAGIAAAKRTAEWIPLCHPLLLTHIDVTARLCKNGVEVASASPRRPRPAWRWKRW